jgi:CRP-like cAMP-binding protein
MNSGADGGYEQTVFRRLNGSRRLSDAGIAAIRAAVREKVLKIGAGEDIVCEGDRTEKIRILLSGWACRYKMLEDGRRQIVNFVLPGNICDPFIYLFPTTDHSIGTLTPVVYSELERSHFERLIATDATLAEALYCEMIAEVSIQREWTINLGRRDALERVAHVICELFERLNAVGLADGTSFAFPMTQTDLADATGLSTVHLNRTLQELRSSGLITLRDRNLTINDFQALSNAAMFNPNYLHLGGK